MLQKDPVSQENVPANWLGYRLALLCVYLGIFVALAISPFNRADWLLENALTFMLLIVCFATWRSFCFSPTSNTLLFLFLSLHAIGAHYTYSNVPIESWWAGIFGWSLNEELNLSRNHYDRLVHFCFGLLLFIPLHELLYRRTELGAKWSIALAVTTILATSMIYELIEWIAAEVLGGDLGHAYVGAQGDIWDAQKDMSLATAGCLLGLAAGIVFRKVQLQRSSG